MRCSSRALESDSKDKECELIRREARSSVQEHLRHTIELRLPFPPIEGRWEVSRLAPYSERQRREKTYGRKMGSATFPRFPSSRAVAANGSQPDSRSCSARSTSAEMS